MSEAVEIRIAAPDIVQHSQAERLHAIITGAMAQIELLYIAVGQSLTQVRDHKLYEQLGHPTFRSYLADPSVAMSPAHAYRLIETAAFYRPLDREPLAHIEDAQLAALGSTRAHAIRPLLQMAPERAEAIVEQAQALTVTDVQLLVRSAQDPGLTIVQEAAHELSRKVIALGYHLRHGSDPIGDLASLRAVIDQGADYLWKLGARPSEETPEERGA